MVGSWTPQAMIINGGRCMKVPHSTPSELIFSQSIPSYVSQEWILRQVLSAAVF